MMPLLAAIAHKQPRAAARLLDGGADPNRVHPLFGSPVHAATGAGEVELLQLLLERGATRLSAMLRAKRRSTSWPPAARRGSAWPRSRR